MYSFPSSTWLLLSLLSPSEERAHVRKLSGALPTDFVADVSDFALAPGGRWIVYRADAVLDGRLELFVVPAEGGEPPRALCGPLEAEVDVADYRFTPDGSRVVYRIGETLFGEGLQLFSAALDGSSPPVRLHARPTPGGGVVSLPEIDADSRFAVFIGDVLTSQVFELYRVPLDGSAPPLTLTPSLAPGGDVFSARLSPDGQRVVYLARQDHFELELYSVPLDGGPSVRISGPLIVDGGVSDFRITADGTRVVYRAQAFDKERYELFVVPIDGGAPPLVLNAPLVSDGQVQFDFALDPAGVRAVFRVGMSSNGPWQIHSAPLDGSASAIRLDASTVAPGVPEGMRLDPSGERVLYRDRPASSAGLALFSAPTDGSAPPVKLGTWASNANVGLFECTADGRRVVYTRITGATWDLFVVPTDGSAPALQLDGVPSLLRYDLGVFRVGAERVAFLGRPGSSEDRELFSVPLDGSAAPLQLLALNPPRGDVQLDLALAGDDVLYRSDSTRDEVFELSRVPLDGSAAPASLSGPGPNSTVGDVTRFALAGRNALYLADQEAPGVHELFTRPLERGGPPRRLNEPLASFADVLEFQLSPDETTVAFASTGFVGRSQLSVVPSDGHAPERSLYVPPSGTGVHTDFRFSADGRWLVFVSSEAGRGRAYAVPSDGSAPARLLFDHFDDRLDFVLAPDSSRAVLRVGFRRDRRQSLWSVPLDGSASAVPINFIRNSQGDITDFAVSADARRVVYRADREVDDHYQLYSLPLAGGASEVRLQPPQALDAVDFDFPAGSARVVYRAYGPQGRIELYATLADGSTVPTRLAAMPAFGRVRPFVLSPDGARVLYRADANTDERFELFCVASDGSAPPVQLSVATRADADVSAFAFTPDSRSVLFLADTLRNEQDDLYLVAADRSAPPRRLNPPLPPNATVFDFRIEPEGAFVAYRSNNEEHAFAELYRVPLDGRTPAVRVNAPLAAAGDVRDYLFAGPDELVYAADQEADEAYELYASVLGRLARASGAPR